MHGPGDMRGLDIMGLDFGTILDSATGAAKGVASYVTDKKAADAASADSEAKVQAAITADGDATSTLAAALMSADLAATDPRQSDVVAADKMAADSAAAAMAEAGAAVMGDGARQKRADAAKKRVAVAQTALQTALKSGNVGAKKAAQFQLQAAQQIQAKVAGGALTVSDSKSKKPVADDGGEGEGVLSRTIVGPIKVWHAGAAALLGGGGIWWFRRRKGS